MRLVVIGAGFGGLAAAIRLRAQGHHVTVVEKCDRPGGRAYVFERDGFVFDAGPTILTAPHLIDELFALLGRRREDEVQLVPLDPFYTVRFEDGTAVRWSGREDDIVRQLERVSPDDVAGYRRFSARAEAIFRAAYPLIDRPFESLGPMLRALPDLWRARAWRSVASLASDCVRDPRLRQLLSFHPLLIGGNPFEASAIYALIHTLEKRWGVWYAMGGTGALVAAMARVFVAAGGELRLGAEVARVVVDVQGRRATGVELSGGERLTADAVVSNADVAETYLRLLPPDVRRVNTDRRIARWRQSMSVFVIYFGTDRKYEHVGHHEILMGPRYRGLLDDVFRHRTLAEDFSLYLHRPTATDPSLAPPSADCFYVLAPVPNLGGRVDWEREGDAFRDRIMQYLERRYLPGLSRHIVTEFRIDPRYFRDELNSHLGNAFSVAPLLRQSAWFRPHAVSEDVPNLFFVGAGTHPGAGIPGVLSSAKIVADLVRSRYGEVRHTPVSMTALAARR